MPSKTYAGLTINAPRLALNGTLKDGLVGYWSFDGPDMAGDIAYDRSGQGNNGTLTNGPRRTIGRIGQALEFDKVDDFLNAGSNASIDNVFAGGGSVSAWVRPKSVGEDDNGIIADKRQGASGWDFLLFLCTTGGCGFDGIVPELAHTYSGADGTWVTSAVLTPNEWHHVVVVYDKDLSSNDPVFYVNGLPATTLDVIVPTGVVESDDSQPLTIGGTTPTTNTFDGSIDEVRVYNRVLSADEIKRLYKIGATFTIGKSSNTGTLKDGLVGYWSFDGPDMAQNSSGVLTAYDRSGQSNHASTTGGTATIPKKTIGRIGQALEFDGVDDFMNAGSAASLDNLTANTKSMWVYSQIVGAGNTGTIMGKRTAGASGWQIFLYSTGELEYFVEYSGATELQKLTDANTTKPNQWHHVVVVDDGSANCTTGLRIYIDSVESAYTPGCTNGAGGRANDGSDTVCMAFQDTTCTSNPFTGKIDEVRIYNRALSADEIKRLYKIGATFVINKPVATGSLLDGLVGYWSFEDSDLAQNNSGVLTAYDRSGNNNHGNSTAAANTPKRAIGKIGQALEFDGTDDFVNSGELIPSIEAISRVTYSAWVKRKARNAFIDIGMGDNGSNIFNMMEAFNDGLMYFLITGSAVNGSFASNDTDWHHVTFVFDGTQSGNAGRLRGYLDGVLQTLTFSGTIPATTATGFDVNERVFLLGRNGNDGTGYSNGLIDEVRVYNRALSADEIKRLYRMGGGR